MPNLPKFVDQLVDTEEYDESEVAFQGDNPCDGCGRFHYTEETSCSVADQFTREGELPQHCQCWYDCDPCCKCGEDGTVLHGPPVAFMNFSLTFQNQF